MSAARENYFKIWDAGASADAPVSLFHGRGRTRRAFQIVWHNQQKPRRAVCSAGLLSIGKEVY